MKARITILFATAVTALTVAGGALAAPQQTSIHGWSHSPSDYTRPGAVKPNPSSIRGSYEAVKPNPTGARGSYEAVKPNPSGSRGSITPNPWSIRRARPNPMGIRGGALAYRPNPSCIRGAATAV